MDLEALMKCEDEDDFSRLMMDDVMGGYNGTSIHPNHIQIAIVEHPANYTLDQIKSFFGTVDKNLNVKFWVGDGTNVKIEGVQFHRYDLYSDEEPIINIQFADGLYRFQEPMVEREDGITIDVNGKFISFKNNGEVLYFNSFEEMHKTTTEILEKYWPNHDHPEIAIKDSISNYPRTKFMVESFADHITTIDGQVEKIMLAERFEKYIPELKFVFNTDDYA